MWTARSLILRDAWRKQRISVIVSPFQYFLQWPRRQGRDTLVIGAVRVVGRSDEDDPVDSPAAERHQRSTATGPGPADLSAALGGAPERCRANPRGDRRVGGRLDPPGRPPVPHLPQQGPGSTLHPALPR